jgi:hypothetical protein
MWRHSGALRSAASYLETSASKLYFRIDVLLLDRDTVRPALHCWFDILLFNRDYCRFDSSCFRICTVGSKLHCRIGNTVRSIPYFGWVLYCWIHTGFNVTCSSCTNRMLPKYFKYSTFSSCLWSVIICIIASCIKNLIVLVFSTFVCIPQHLHISILSLMPCSTASFLASSSRSSAEVTVRITLPTVLKSPKPSGACLVRCSLKNRIGHQQQPCLTPLPVLTLLASHWSSLSLTNRSTYMFLINLPSRIV